MRDIQMNRGRGGRGGWGGRLFLLAAIAAVIIGIMNLQKIKDFVSGPKPVVKRVQPIPKQGQILLPIAGRGIPAYTRVSDRDITYVIVLKAKVEGKDILTDDQEIKGRVTCLDIEPALPFRSSMLGPKDAQPTWRDFIPLGFVAQKLDKSQVEGQFEDLKAGDFVALYNPSVKWVSQKAKVMVPYSPKVTVTAGGAGGTDIFGRPDKSGATGPRTTVSGSLTLALPPEDSLVLSKILAEKSKDGLPIGRVRIVALGLNPAVLDAGENPGGESNKNSTDRPAKLPIQELRGKSVIDTQVPAGPVEPPGGV